MLAQRLFGQSKLESGAGKDSFAHVREKYAQANEAEAVS
jgi:hypothetical protein